MIPIYRTVRIWFTPHRHWESGCIPNWDRPVLLYRSCWALSKNCGRILLALSCLSVRPSVWNNSAPTGRIFMKFDIRVFFEKTVEKSQVSVKSDKNIGHFTWRLLVILIISHSVLLRMRNISGKSCRESQHTRLMLTLILLMWTIWRAPTNASKWRMGFNSAFKGLKYLFFRKSCRLWDKVDKYCTVEEAADYNMTHAHCMLDT